MRLICLAAALLTCSGNLWAKTEACTPLNSTKMDDFDLKMDSADVVGITNKKTSRTCKTSYGNLANTFRMGKTNKIILEVASGSSGQVIVYDVSECKEVWTTASDAGAHFDQKSILVDGSCECEDIAKEKCDCESSRVYFANAKCELVLDKKKSLAATKKKIGLAFEGKAKLFHPNQTDVRILK